MMSEEQLWRTEKKESELPELSKRKRTPSQYASQIDNFKNNISSSFKKTRSSKALVPSSFNQSPQSPQCQQRLLCLLPSGQSINLKFILEPNKQLKIDRNNKKKSSKDEKIIQHPKFQKTPSKSQPVNFWDKFLLAFKEIENKQSVDKRLMVPAQGQISQKQKGQQKLRKQKEREQKWNRSYDRYQQISSKLVRLQENLFFL